MNAETNQKRKLPKWAKILAIVLGSLLCLAIIVWALAGWYINSHREQLLQKITTTVSENLDGDFSIGNMQPALFKGFPDVALELEDVALRDSLYKVHHRNTFQFEKVYVKFNLFSMLGGHPHIEKITLTNGQMNLFTDSSGYSNDYLLKKKTGKKKSGKKPEFSLFSIENVLFTFQHDRRHKKIQLLIQQFAGSAKERNNKMHIVARTKIHVNQLGFNLKKGSYLENKDFSARLRMIFDREKGELKLPFQPIRINETNLKVGATFHFKEKPSGFEIRVDANSIAYKEAVSYLSQNISKKLTKFNLASDISLQAKLKGLFSYPDTPIVHAQWQTVKNDFQTNFGELKQASFSGEFFNHVVPGKGKGDDNTLISFDKLSANYMGIPIVADSIHLFNLLHPTLDFNLTSGFPVARLNNVLNQTFEFTKGTADLKVHYHGGVSTHDSLGHSVTGGFKIKHAAFTYVPHNIAFSDGNFDLSFNGEDLIVKNSTLHTENSDISLHGEAKQFMNVYFNDPQKAVFEWYLHSDTLNLEEFKNLIEVRTVKRKAKKRKSTHRVNERLAMLMEKSRMNVHATIDRLYYQSFSAKKVEGELDLDQSNIAVNPLKMQFADGSLNMVFKIVPGDEQVPFSVKADLSNINTSKLFYGLGNLGQNTITSKNIAGEFDGRVDIKGKFNSRSQLLKPSLNGTASFQLTDGELINFKPFKSIQKFVFKKRNLSHISFGTIKNDLTINQGKVKIPPMDIHSSAINMSLQGIYSFGSGTDIGLTIPLRNPKKVQRREKRGLPPKKNKGIVLHLRAVDDGEGGVKIVWDPLQKAPSEKDIKNADN